MEGYRSQLNLFDEAQQEAYTAWSQKVPDSIRAIVHTMVEMVKVNDLNIYKYLPYFLS